MWNLIMSLFMRPTQGVEYVENFSQMYEQGREKEERELCGQVAYYPVKIRHGAQKACSRQRSQGQMEM